MEKTLPIRSIRRSPSAGMSHSNRPDKANFEDRDLDVSRNTVNASIRTYALSGIIFSAIFATSLDAHEFIIKPAALHAKSARKVPFTVLSTHVFISDEEVLEAKPLKLRCSRVSSRWTYLLKQTLFENPRWCRVCANQRYGDHCRSSVRTG